MTPGSSLDALAARWAARPEPGVFAALAEGLAKRGDLAEAARVVAAGLARYPGHAAGLVAQARIALAQGDRSLAVRALAILLERDPGHPLGREMATELAPELLPTPDGAAAAIVSAGAEPVGEAVTPVPADPSEEAQAAEPGPAAPPPPEAGDGDPEPPAMAADLPESGEPADPADLTGFDALGEVEAPPIITESLAALYHQQGHLEEAMAAYAELAARDPSNDTIASRHESLRRELAARRPLPFDARQSGGRGVAEWLGGIAAARPAGRPDDSPFDAFYQQPPAPADATADFDAFQRWLEELAR